MINLLPCPFCGGEAEIQEFSIWNVVYCKECSASVSELDEITKVLSVWNKRVTSSISVQKLKNERGAGRKRKDVNVVDLVLHKRYNENYTIRSIAYEMGLSVGCVHKLINEHEERFIGIA